MREELTYSNIPPWSRVVEELVTSSSTIIHGGLLKNSSYVMTPLGASLLTAVMSCDLAVLGSPQSSTWICSLNRPRTESTTFRVPSMSWQSSPRFTWSTS